VEEVSNKSARKACLLCIFLGGLGVHRFYVGRIWTGILTILTILGFLGIWPLIDLVKIVRGEFTDKHGRKLENGTERDQPATGSSHSTTPGA
jgi:TM2 domain-containing membrane protein YozV